MNCYYGNVALLLYRNAYPSESLSLALRALVYCHTSCAFLTTDTRGFISARIPPLLFPSGFIKTLVEFLSCYLLEYQTIYFTLAPPPLLTPLLSSSAFMSSFHVFFECFSSAAVALPHLPSSLPPSSCALLLPFLPPPPSLLCVSLFILSFTPHFSLLSLLCLPPTRFLLLLSLSLCLGSTVASQRRFSARLQLACAPAIKPGKPLVIRPFR